MNLRLTAPLCLLGLASLLTGCAMQTTAPLSVDTTFVPGAAISGTVHGGSQPITGAKVYLLAVNPSAYGGPGIDPSAANASVSLLNPTTTGNPTDSIGSFVLTNASGGFSLAGDFACSTGYKQGTTTSQTPYSTNQTPGSEQVYLYILGGTPSFEPAPAPNPSAGLLAALGPCNSPTLKIVVNEITTIATAYAFAGFASDATHIGSSGSTLAITNLSNAFANVANLASVSTGAAATKTVGGNGTSPSANVITLASILAACVNSNGATSGCLTLFKYASSKGATGNLPTDTATAAINLAHNPYPTAPGVTDLYSLVPSTGAPFAGSLTTAPNDFTLGLSFTGGGISDPYAIAIDASGNAWTANYGNNSVTELSSNGTAISGANGFTSGGISKPYSIAIDASDNVWIANYGNSSVSELSSNGTAISGANGFTSGGISEPYSIAIDASGNVWTSNYGNNSVSKLSSNGTAISGANGFTGSDLNVAGGIAIDASGNVWTEDYGNNSVYKLSSNGTAISGANGFTGGGLDVPYSIAIDASGNAWTTNFSNNSVTELSSNGSAISGSNGFTGGGLDYPQGIAIDASGNVWNTNLGNNSVSERSSKGVPISGASGFTGASINSPSSIAIDGSGNVWTANYSNVVTELIGAAAPVVTPLAANLVAPYGTSTINRP